jgi:hypothetical protein
MTSDAFPLTNAGKISDSNSGVTIRHSRHLQARDSVASVTKVLKETMPVERRLALQRWEERMIREMGKDSFDRMQEATLARGEWLHSAVEVHSFCYTRKNFDIVLVVPPCGDWKLLILGNFTECIFTECDFTKIFNFAHLLINKQRSFTKSVSTI